jgi:alkylation response protein AidB-like acyl-CoA dehydrogenase
MNQRTSTDRETLVTSAKQVAEKLRPFEAEHEQRRMLHPDAVQILRESNLFKVIQPSRIGGFEADISTLHAVGKELAYGCAASSWVYMVTAAHTWILGMYPEVAQDELRASDPDTILPGSLASNGKAALVDGGFRVTGRWQFGSGCDYGKWVIVGAMQSNSTRDDPKHVHVLVPAGDFEIDDTWHTLGLRGTGSKDIIVNDAFVPTHRAMPTGTLFDGSSPHARSHKTFCYQLPVLATLTFCLTAPTLALTQRIYDEFIKLTAIRKDRYDGSTKAKKPSVQIRVAESWAEIQSAELLIEEIARIFDHAGEFARPLDVQTRVELKMRASYAVTLCRRAADRLFDAAGANAIYERSPLLPLIQNLHTMSHHAIVDFDNNAAALGSNALGLGPGTILF